MRSCVVNKLPGTEKLQVYMVDIRRAFYTGIRTRLITY